MQNCLKNTWNRHRDTSIERVITIPDSAHCGMLSYLLRLFRPTAGIILCGVLMVPPAYSLGIGMPTLNPVIGQPLRIEIPLQLAPGEVLSHTGCAYIAPPHDAPDRQLFPAHARVEIDTTGPPKIVILSPQLVTEPLLEFRLSVGCNNDLSRNYLILTDPPPAHGSAQSPPAATAAPVAVTLPPTPEAGQPRTTLESSRPTVRRSLISASIAGDTLTVAANTNLNALARQRYPRHQATRDEYRRLMAQANPHLFAGKVKTGAVALAAGTVLALPPYLPLPENQASTGSAAAASLPHSPRNPSKGFSVRTATAQPKDRLIVGGDRLLDRSTMNLRQMSDAIDRMERMVEDQGRTAVNISESLYSLNRALIEGKNYIQTLEARQKQHALEQRALQARVENAEARLEKMLGVWELLALIVASGGVGAALLMLHHRLHERRSGENTPFREITKPATREKTPESSRIADVITPSALPRDTPTAPHATAATAFTRHSMPQPSPQPSPPASPAARRATSPRSTSRPSTSSHAVQPPFRSPPTAFAVSPATTYPHSSEVPSPATAAHAGAEAAASSLPSLSSPFEFELISLPEGEYDPEADIKSTDPRYRPTLPFTPESVSHKNSALELASIMESMGLVNEAADTIVEHLARFPKDDLEPWLKALSLYRKTGRQAEFQSLAEKLHQELNVEPHPWDYDPEQSQPRSLLEFQRIISQVQELWHLDDKSECEALLNDLLLDNRGSMRNGFPQDVAEEIALLLKLLRTDLVPAEIISYDWPDDTSVHPQDSR